MQVTRDSFRSKNIGRLAVDGLHSLHVEEHGNPFGLPVVILHGGPGAGLNIQHAETFDPLIFRIVMFDQRGCGQSTPHGSIENNTTQDLLDDLEKIRIHLNIEKWLVAGGSWGSCLALAYGQAHPQHCLGFRLHGIFLAEAADIDWWFQGSRTVYPDYWEEFAAPIPPQNRHALLAAYHQALTSGDLEEELAAAIRLRRFSALTQTFKPDPAHVQSLTEPKAALALSRLFTHYCINGAFLSPGQLIRDIDRIRHLPCEIVQGRYDMVTPMAAAWRLKTAWPEAEFAIVTEANHQSTVEPVVTALGEATKRLGDKIRGKGGVHAQSH